MKHVAAIARMPRPLYRETPHTHVVIVVVLCTISQSHVVAGKRRLRRSCAEALPHTRPVDATSKSRRRKNKKKKKQKRKATTKPGAKQQKKKKKKKKKKGEKGESQ